MDIFIDMSMHQVHKIHPIPQIVHLQTHPILQALQQIQHPIRQILQILQTQQVRLDADM